MDSAAERKKTGYLGPEGTYSALAANKLCAGARLIPYISFFTLFGALKSGELDNIVLPIENTLNGAVTQNLDLLQETDGVRVSAACTVKIEHRLITLAGADLDRISVIYSHPQALAQCGRYLAERFPDARLIGTASTADSISKIKKNTDAGIVGAHIKAEGYDIGSDSISDEKENYTQFILVERGHPEIGGKSERIFFTFTCSHKAGALYDVLAIIKFGGLNMTKIESRPIKDRAGEFRFFIELEGDYSSVNVIETLKRLQQAASSFKLLGYYGGESNK